MENIKDIIYKLELYLLRPEVRTSAEKINELISDDFIEYGSSGLIYNKENILERLPQGNSLSYNLFDFDVIILSENIVQTRFKIDRTNLDNTKTTSLRASLWRKNNDNWQIFFHQGTPIKEI
jgi:hypothetical protein